MQTGILIIAHGQLGQVLIDCASHILGRTPERLTALSAGHDEPREAFLALARREIGALDEGNGVLILTDLFGATPSNFARELIHSGKVAALAGVSMPILLRALNDRNLPAAPLAARALTAAVECTAILE